jgi:N-acetylneuraminate synthase
MEGKKINAQTRPVTIIAEAGVNHNGDINLACKLIDIAVKAKVDIVKFQTFRAEAEISASAPKAEYQKETTGSIESQLDMVRKLELPLEDFAKLKHYCERKGIIFLSTAFDMPSIDCLHALGLPLWKIPSGEITNVPYLRKIGGFGQKIMMSTGMAVLGEVETALDILEKAGAARKNITLLHCTTEYPTSMEDVNLRAMTTMRAAFPGIAGVGYSDHTSGIEVALAAVALGASVIEKHITLDKTMTGPDHSASLNPDELTDLVRGVRNVERALGTGMKKPAPSELRNIIVARKSLMAAKPIKKGERLSEENLTVKRPGSGISAIHWDAYLGRVAERDYAEDELL